MDDRKVVNYYKVSKFSLLFNYYMYVDSADYYADDMFVKHKVHVAFGDEMVNPEHEFRCIWCRCPKWESWQFVKAMKDVAYLMMLNGKKKYFEVCRQIEEKAGGMF